MKSHQNFRRTTALFLAVFVLGCLYYFCGGDPCPFHCDNHNDGLSHSGGHSSSHCLCASASAVLVDGPVIFSRVDCLGRCSAEASLFPPDVDLPGLTHPPQA